MKEEYNFMMEIKRLRQELQENAFLKKAAAYFAKEID